jgi:very-short-patch-repair endonuclease
VINKSKVDRMFVTEYENITERVRRLRRNVTPSEQVMWEVLKGRRLFGHKFRRQHPIFINISASGHKTYYIIDFYCTELKLAVEVDGPVHETQVEYDRRRDNLLRSKGIRVVRITNEEVSDIDFTTKAITEAITQITKTPA